MIMSEDFMTEKISMEPELYEVFEKKWYGNMDEVIFEKIQE